MGLLKMIFGGRDLNKGALNAGKYFEVLNGYTPVFSNAPESIYEMELTRAAIHAFATHCSKLKPEIIGAAYKSLANTLQFKPNPFMDASKFLYRVATILSVNNNAFIVPIEDENSNTVGFFPLLPQNCEVLDVGGKAFLRYTFSNGQRAAIELERAGLLTQFQYSDDFFGADNRAFRPTMELINSQNQGIINGVKNSAFIRFVAKIANVIKTEDINAERKRFTEENLSAENQSGVIMFDNKFSDIKPIESKPFIINAAQMQKINENVFNYFGVSEKILQNNFSDDEYNAFYTGKIEPFALKLSLVMTNMTFTEREIAHGNKIYFTSNSLKYASNKVKLDVATSFFDRGILSVNQILDLFGNPGVEGGDQRYIRKEYAKIEDLGKEFLEHVEITEENGKQGVSEYEPADDEDGGEQKD